MNTARFYKYQAMGNDMLVIDPATFPRVMTPAVAQRLCDRHFGVGADGICYGPLPNIALPTMRFYNPDGSEAEKSGNGLRIFARYVWEKSYATERHFQIGIGDAVIPVQIQDATAHTISTGMGQLAFHSPLIPMTGVARDVVDETLTIDGQTYLATAVNVGNPHCVIFDQPVTPAAIQQFGPVIEVAPLFPNRINVQFVEVIDRHTIHIEIWERGAGYTLASGTSSCAAAGAAVRTGRCESPVTVQMAGGTATVALDDEWNAHLTGTVEAIAQGELALDLIKRF
ncbi:MAG: diaminopimelate epimerase [Anaerolineaceae bacterium]|nr:diaminopimelate epimerase [Anaerolineaceae bacterium]